MRASSPFGGNSRSQEHHLPAHIYGFFSGKQKLWIFDPANAEQTLPTRVLVESNGIAQSLSFVKIMEIC